MSTQVVGYKARRFLLKFEDEDGRWAFKFDVFKLTKSDGDDWVEIFQAEEDENETLGLRLVLAALLTEVVEMLEKWLSFLKGD